MSTPLIVKSTIQINGTAAQVWDALVNPAQTKKYMFGCEALSDWKPGSDLLWQGEHDGQPMVFVKGRIVEIRPEEFLAYTTIDPNSGIEDIAANHLVVTYEIKKLKDAVELTATQGDYSKVGEGQKRYDETVAGGGWMPILVEVKKLVEGA
ncbi:MAG: hypothetical protein EOO88_55290 [Pedobacter sp.]|nr:MAG: hypothetical protein EOO88_55290 [Pedobacter sp.]